MAENNHFDLRKDRFGCIQINTNLLPVLSDQELSTELPALLTRWQTDGVRGIWAKVNIKHSHLVPVFVNNNFEYHHAQPKYVMLKKWLSQSEPDSLPPYSNQYLGAAGFVVNDNNQLLVIQERYHDLPHWKLPGGHANTGEEIGEAARREVLEETGIDSEFQYIICFRHMHRYRYGLSDFYFICLMKPITHQIKKCEREIADARWLDLDEYINHPGVTAANRHFAECYQSMLLSRGYQLRPCEVLNYSKTGDNLVYSLQCVSEKSEEKPSDSEFVNFSDN